MYTHTIKNKIYICMQYINIKIYVHSRLGNFQLEILINNKKKNIKIVKCAWNVCRFMCTRYSTFIQKKNFLHHIPAHIYRIEITLKYSKHDLCLWTNARAYIANCASCPYNKIMYVRRGEIAHNHIINTPR